MKCIKCNREAEMFWKDKEKQNGHSETFYRDMCASCYELTYGKRPKSLWEINEDRKNSSPSVEVKNTQ